MGWGRRRPGKEGCVRVCVCVCVCERERRVRKTEREREREREIQILRLVTKSVDSLLVHFRLK